jgi:hypothetical protein
MEPPLAAIVTETGGALFVAWNGAHTAGDRAATRLGQGEGALPGAFHSIIPYPAHRGVVGGKKTSRQPAGPKQQTPQT